MAKKIIVEISGLQEYEGQEQDNVELVTSGTLDRDDDGVSIVYEENEMSGMGSTTTTVKIEQDKTSIIRFGQTRSHMIFEEGQKHLSYYDTPFGSLTVGITTHSIQRRLGPLGGELSIFYSMEINNSLAGENSFCLKYRFAK